MKPILLKSLIKKILGKSEPQSTSSEKPVTLDSLRGKYKNYWEDWFVETLINSRASEVDKKALLHRFLKTAGKWEPDAEGNRVFSSIIESPNFSDEEKLRGMMAYIAASNKEVYYHPPYTGPSKTDIAARYAPDLDSSSHRYSDYDDED